jgi:hypothetical protein
LTSSGTLWADDSVQAGHVLNRIGYGPTLTDLQQIEDLGAEAYIGQQLDPRGIDESDNTRLHEKVAALFQSKQPSRDSTLIRAGEFWRYFKGTQEPPVQWKQSSFDDSAWLGGATGIGYDDDDDLTVLEDMRNSYLSVYLRKRFTLTTEARAEINNLILEVDFDDSFKAFLNGTEVARVNLPAGFVAYNQTSSGSHEAGTPETFDLTALKHLLRDGDNVLAIQVHNRSLDSSDLSMIPMLVSRTELPGDPIQVIDGVSALQQLVHIRGVYSKRQLQAVLAEFWENHFTTDYDKLVEYFDELQNSDGTDAMTQDQARAEAAQVEYEE